LVEEIENNSYLGFKVIGFLDDRKAGRIGKLDILGKVSDLENIVKRYFVDEIYITFPSERQKVAEIIFSGKKLGKTVRIVADSFDFPFGDLVLNYIGLVPLLAYHKKGLHGSEEFIKRFLDIIVSGAGLVLLSPLFVIVGTLIKLDSPGSVFYVSKRSGRKCRVFNFYKFRSMVAGADKDKEALRHRSEVKGPIFKIKDDPRVTSLGRILRIYSLDELPQLINVLKGDMSLVGPRPPTPDEVKRYDFWQMRRLEIRPGITCLWQVRGRSDLSFYKWVKWDLWYIDNWSLGLDLKILLWTITAVLKRKGAY
jgi:exopolysaccharide biosynthesis polyprenyl glycosylphosphotransferase